MLSGKSLMKRRNRRGPSTEPWGTPLTTGTLSDDSPSTKTCLEWNVMVHVMFEMQAAMSAAMNSNLGRVTSLQVQLLGKHDGKTLPGR